MQAKEHHQYVAEHFQNLGDRLLETEQGLARISSLAVSSGTSAVEAAPMATERGRRDDLTSTNKENRDESIEPPEAIAVAKTFEYIHEELANFAARLEAAESAIEASAHSGEDIPSATSSQEFHETEKMQEQEVDELRSQLDERLCELHERLDDLEGRLQDLQVDQDVRQEASHVGEQVFRLAMRMQRLESNGAANGVSIEAARGLHTELGDLSEQLFHLSGRLTHAERGLSGMAEGFDRICEELAHLRSEHTVDRTGSAVEQEAGYEAAERDVNTESEPLHHKVLEMERSHATVAEVVWELRKQVSGLRTSLATLQSSIGGEEIVASSFHSRNASPGSIPS
jgi:vacuolar-type H+-ATPase subunit I/STV1